MNSNLLKTLMYASKYALYLFLLQVAGMQLLIAGPVSSQALKDVNISIQLNNVELKEIFGAIKAQTDFVFTFSDKTLEGKNPMSIHVESVSLEEVLLELAEKRNLRFKRVNKNISVIDTKEQGTKTESIIELDKTVQGRVLDGETGEGLAGATVQVKNSSLGTITDIDGNFSLSIPQEEEMIVISFVGFFSVELSINDQSTFDISLQPDVSKLNEIIVYGYGTGSKEKFNGAVSSVESEELTQVKTAGFDQQLVGKLAGVQVNTVNGQPGEDAQIVIRGTGTITAGTNPLIVIDGIPLTEGSSLSSVNPNDIEKIDILKDAASAAIYGSRGANGVIFITTKKGKEGELNLVYDSYFGFQTRSDQLEYANAYESAQYFTEARDYGYVSRDPDNRSITDDRDTRIANGANLRELRLHYLDPYLAGTPGLTDTDWMDEIFRTATMTNHSLSLSGGNKDSDFYVSGNYFKQDGIAIETDFERYSGVLKANHRLNDKFKVGFAINPSYAKQNAFKSVGDWRQDPLAMSITAYPFFEVYKADGSLNIGDQLAENAPEDGALQENPVAWTKSVKSEYTRTRTFGNIYLDYEPLDGLVFKSFVAADFRNERFDYFNPSFIGTYRTPPPKVAEARESNRTSNNLLTELTANYSKFFGDHYVDVIAGYTYQKENGFYNQITGTDFTDDNVANIGGASSFGIDTERYTWSLISYLARAQYTFKDRYQFSAAVRRDGSSRFGANNRWAIFPSVSLGWIISDETFLQNSGPLTFAKLRASWGQTGNNQIGSYSSQSLIEPDNYAFGNTLSAGKAKTTAPNPNLSWETNTSYNIGLDFGFINRLNLSVEYYQSNTTDLLLEVPVPEQSGFSTSLQNLGEVKNNGFEFQLTGTDFKIGEVSIGFDANLTTYKNEVVSLGDQERIATGRQSSFVTEVGQPIATITGYKVTGVYKSQSEIDDSPHLEGTLPGDYVVEDVNLDGVIDADDKIGVGTHAPDLTYGFGLNLKYKNFDFSASAYGVEGRTIYDATLAVLLETGEGFSIPSKHYFDNRYHPQNNPDGYYAQPNMGNFSAARRETRASDIAFTNGDFFRVRSLTLGYSIPGDLLEKVKINSLRIYFTANNPFTFTDYLGYNLEQSSSNPLTAGNANWGGYPAPKSFVMGLNLKF